MGEGDLRSLLIIIDDSVALHDCSKSCSVYHQPYSTVRTSYCVAVHFVSTGHSHLAGSKNCMYEYSSFPLAHNENEPLIVCAVRSLVCFSPRAVTPGPNFPFRMALCLSTNWANSKHGSSVQLGFLVFLVFFIPRLLY